MRTPFEQSCRPPYLKPNLNQLGLTIRAPTDNLVGHTDRTWRSATDRETLSERLRPQLLQCSHDSGVQFLWIGGGKSLQFADHPVRPEQRQMPGDPGRGTLGRQGGVIAGNLLGHPDEGLDQHGYRLTVASAPAPSTMWSPPCRFGDTSTAVTLYSGQLVAQSELSVVTTLAPLTG